MNPLVSITMGTYNRPHWVREAVQSVYAQEFQDWEIILINDGGCPIFPDKWGFVDERLMYIPRKNNMGFAYTLNQAINLSRGKYICYLGDDDKYYPHHLRTLVEAMDGFDGEVVYSDLYKVHCTVDGPARSVIKKENSISRDFDRQMIMETNHTLGGAMMHTRTILNKTGGYWAGVPVYIDWDMTRRMCFFTDFLHIPKITGEFYASVNKSDRISTKQRQNQAVFNGNVENIRRNVPQPPWSHVKDLADYGKQFLYFDNLYHIARDMDKKSPAVAAKLYNHLWKKYGNTNWIQTREASSLLACGCFVDAFRLINEVSKIMPTTETMDIMAKCYVGMGEHDKARGCFEVIDDIINNNMYWDNGWKGLK